MDLRPDDHVTVLLTAHLPGAEGQRPLSTGEWSRLFNWLREHDLRPGDMLVGDPRNTLAGFHDKTVTLDRIQPLLDRGFQTGLLLEKWQRSGLWVITRSSPDYPALLLKRLGDQAPPLFHGAGDRRKLHTKALAVVGSRNAGVEDLQFARQLGHAAAAQGWSIVSGGARGVDEASMRGAIEANGTVIGVVADSLLKTATSHKYRDAIQRSDIVLLSPYHPESGFSGPNAMARNKHVYCLSRAAVVVCSDTGKGGTWAGATEGLKKKWVPVWVKPQADERSGNRALLGQGAMQLPDRDPHALRMEDLEQGSPGSRELCHGQQADVQEPVPSYRSKDEGPAPVFPDFSEKEKQDLEELLKLLRKEGPLYGSKITKELNWRGKQKELLNKAVIAGFIKNKKVGKRVKFSIPTNDQLTLDMTQGQSSS
jgi:predicted Rossmann fold nucleotide-binding protein DprA/Smf involved in DNA uptake